jgi:uncharacterized membrane protein
MTTLALCLTVATVLFAGLMAGLFYAFSISVMPGLDSGPPETAIAAMAAINRVIQNPVFFATFFLTPVIALAAAAALWMVGQKAACWLMLLSAAVYLAGAFLPTVAVNVPLNNALDAVALPKPAADAARAWQDYSPRWTWWNSLRAVACSVSTVAAGLALYVWDRPPA